MEGVVKRWLSFRGYGFIKCDDSEDEVFVHHTSIKEGNSLQEGERVRFDIEETPKGPKAINLEII